MCYWRIVAGSDQRDYTADFLKCGMAFVGGTRSKSQMHLPPGSPYYELVEDYRHWFHRCSNDTGTPQTLLDMAWRLEDDGQRVMLATTPARVPHGFE